MPVKKLGPESERGLSAEEEVGRVAKIAFDLISVNKSWVGACDANLRGWARGAANTYPTVAPELFYNSVMEMVSEKVSEKVFQNETVPTWRKAMKQDAAGGNEANTPNPFI